MPGIVYDPKISETVMPMPSPAFVWLAAIVCSFHWHLFGTFPLIDLADETLYMGRVGGSLSAIDWSMPYSLWYKCWHLLTGDPVLSFRFSGIFISSAIVFCVFAILRRMNASQGWAALAGIALVFWEPLAGSPVKVTHFFLLLQLVAVWGAIRSYERNADRFLFFGVCSLWLCFVRQESLGIALGALGISLAFTMGERWVFRRPWHSPPARLLQFALAGLVVLFFFSPFTRDRSWLAFRDHFCWSHGQQNGDEFVRTFFPTARTILGALQENPSAFFSYGKRNVAEFFLALPADLAASFPGWNWHWWIIGAGLLVGLLRGPRDFALGVIGRAKEDFFLFVLGVGALAVLQMLLVTFLFQSDIKYSLSAFVFCLLILFYLLDPFTGRPLRARWVSLGALVIFAMTWAIPLRTPEFPYRWYYQPDVKDQNLMIHRWRASPRMEGKRVLHFRDYSLYFKAKVISQMNPPSFSSVGVDSAGKYLDALGTNFIIFSEGERGLCEASWGRKDCSSLLKTMGECFSVIDAAGKTKLYERVSACSHE